MASGDGIEANEDFIRRFGVARTFIPQEEDEQDVLMRSISFHQQGEVCVTSRNDGVISVVNCLTGMVNKTIFTKRYGVDLVKYTHHPDCILFSSLNDSNDFRLRYHSLFDNKFLRYYTGHTEQVTSLDMHPTADEFMSASLDGTVRLWDLRSSDTTALVRCEQMPAEWVCCAYDPEGVVFAVYNGDSLIRMYDARNYQDGPFAKFSLYDPSILQAVEPLLAQHRQPTLRQRPLHVKAMAFSPDGNNVLVTTNRVGLFLHLDAFEGNLVHLLYDLQAIAPTETPSSPRSPNVSLGASYSADGKFIATGTVDGKIQLYQTKDGRNVHTLQKAHFGPVVDVQWNPQRHLLASAGFNSCVLWTPAL